VMDNSLGFHAVVMLFLDDRGPIDCSRSLMTVVRSRSRSRIAVTLADSHTDTDRSHANTDLFGHRRNGERADCRGDKEKLSHCVLLL
jgi:hypothetical protein